MDQEEFEKTKRNATIKLGLLIVVVVVTVGLLYLDYIGVGAPKYLSIITSLGAFGLLYSFFGEALFTYGKYGDEVKRRQIEKWEKDNAGKKISSGLSKTGKVFIVIAVIIFIYAIYLNIVA